MKKFLILIVCLILLAAAIPALSEQKNPSFYTAGKIAYLIPNYWIANYIEVQELLSNYPDFNCEFYSTVYDNATHDQIVCQSVNNRRSPDVVINFFFEGDYAGMTGLHQVVFTLEIPDNEGIQEVLEYFWLENAYPWHTSDDQFFIKPSLYFHKDTTAMRFDLPNFETEGLEYMIVDFWDAETNIHAFG